MRIYKLFTYNEPLANHFGQVLEAANISLKMQITLR